METELTSFTVQELIDLYNKVLYEDSRKLSTGFIQRGLMNIENELKQRGYKAVKFGDKYRAEKEEQASDGKEDLS